MYKLNSKCALINGIISDKKNIPCGVMHTKKKKIGVKFVCEKCKNWEKYV